MTARTQPLPTAAKPAARGRSTGQIVAVAAGIVIAFGGLLVGGVGGGLFAVFGGNETVTSDQHSFSTQSTALVTEVADIDDTAEVADIIGRPEVQVGVEAANDVFVGIAPAADVDRYLAGAPIEEVTDLRIDPWKLDRSPRSGSLTPDAPGDQNFWVAQGDGTNASLDWKVRDGDYRLVVMNADGSRGVHTAGTAGLKVPHLSAIAWILLGSGFVLLLGGATTAFVAARSGRGPGAGIESAG